MTKLGWSRSLSVALAVFVGWAMTGQASALVVPRAATGGSPVLPVARIEADHGLLDRGLSCTGTLVAPTWVVTAQHCTNIGRRPGHPYRPQDLKVNFAEPVRVEAVYRMPGYDAASLVNDVALLRLAAPVTAVTPARIAPDPLPSPAAAQVYGFGATADGLHTSDVRVTSRAAVNDGPCLFPAGPLTFVMSVHGGSTPGDSGGPMLHWQDDRPLLQTITAGAADRTTCGTPSLEAHPETWVGIYNRVDRASSAGSFLATHIPDL
ncbi:S1 family peptidase [Paractinoplanes lichenicola]|uniref:Trypsin-like serine protease n=1 Tax=Paractinoplanes lichenicola TaxID=2802976 RepID=A0ABS1VSS6_9ACTN|nr:trypsin-like serine protease [Actinoplanes lichenicola]MBL7257516.1 trypsin-like serine protease [Actinoplanes lichenicola]